MSMSYKEAQEEAKKIADEMEASHSASKPYVSFLYDRDVPRIICFKHCDGSFFRFRSSCYREIDKDWFVIFTEHHGEFVYHKEDVEYVREEIVTSQKYLYRNQDF